MYEILMDRQYHRYRQKASSKNKLMISSTSTAVSSFITRRLSTSNKIMGFTKEIIRNGNGSKPRVGQTVTVHCTGYGKNRDLSAKFWSTKDPGQQPFSFSVGLGQVIKGWDESVIDMSIGEIAKIHCSPDYAYGAGGFPAWGIESNSELVFEIEVLSYN